tara:strand:+ start:514 stop:1095 length:582 start_codon:yes stop_codon:yes gene_type:complete
MALELNADIAKELNITTRKGDTFQVKLAVQDPSLNNMPYNLSGIQTNSPLDEKGGYTTAYQGKLTIRKPKTEFESLNVYSYWWKDTTRHNVIPNLSRTGEYSGDKSGTATGLDPGAQYPDRAGIWFKSSTGVLNDTMQITIPGAYMNLKAGVYVYDFQTRKKSFYDASGSDNGASYQTWLYGTFTVIDEVTKQ